MKKLITIALLTTLLFTLSACNKDAENKINPDWIVVQEDCKGEGDYIVVNGQCLLISDILSDRISITGEETLVQYSNSIELMSDFVADLSDSQGLAVVPRDVFEDTINLGGSSSYDLINLSTSDLDETSENLIVKLTNDGFFEEVGFSDSSGLEVHILSNPLALEVFGAYTIVIFEVDFGNENYTPNFTQKVYDSLYAGGIYLIHNESGKLFATKDVTYTENTYTYQEYHSRNVRLSVTLNEPVFETQLIPQFDEFNMPILDGFGVQVMLETQVQLFNSKGEPIIFTEGPILTEMLEVPVVEHFKVQQVDENGDLVFDEFGNPVYDYIDEPVLNENGDPKMEIREVPILDGEGNIQYQEQFEVELFIEDIRNITVTDYYANVQDNPISYLAQRFVDKIIGEYYNWNYYRVNDYMISNSGFASSDDFIFFTEMKADPTDDSKMENFVMKLSFDSETNELLLEEYINATKAGFDNCQIIIDPRNNNIICDSWDNNIKVYSEALGLKTIPNSANLNPVTFPNGELYFYDSMETYVVELGYYTTSLFTINSDGTLESHYIELGEKEEVCVGVCSNYLAVDFYNADGVAYGGNSYLSLELISGDKMLSSADLTVFEIGEFNSTRPDCDLVNGCWGSTLNTIIDSELNIETTFESYFNYFGTDAPPYAATYQIDETTEIYYQQQWSDTDLLCTNPIGCVNQVNLVDNSINLYGIWMNENIIISENEKFISRIVLDEVNSAVYDYTKEAIGAICEYETCNEFIPVRIYDLNGDLIGEFLNDVVIAQYEIIPLYIEYHMTIDTLLTEEANVCTTSTGCWRNYNTPEGYYFSINYQQGDIVYETIQFASTDKNLVTEEILTSTVCTDIYGCNGFEVEYFILDAEDVVLYQFSNYIYADYGTTMPYTVTAHLTDVTIEYQKETLTENAVCEDAICLQQVEFTFGLGYDYEQFGWGNIAFTLGEELIYRISFADDTPYSTVDEMVCLYDEGCTIYTGNFIIQDEDGNVFPTNTDFYYTIPVLFQKGDVIPNTDQMQVSSNFTVTFVMTNIEYLKTRIRVYDFIYNLDNVVILEDNLFLIEKQAWAQGEDNFILTYNDITGRYSAKYTNISAVTEITKFNDGYIAINDDETAIYNFIMNSELTNDDYYFFDKVNLTEGLLINGVNDLIVDYDGSIYFKGVDNFIQDITGTINNDGTLTVDTEIVERQIIRLNPIN